jgi:hypothetical protein
MEIERISTGYREVIITLNDPGGIVVAKDKEKEIESIIQAFVEGIDFERVDKTFREIVVDIGGALRELQAKLKDVDFPGKTDVFNDLLVKIDERVGQLREELDKKRVRTKVPNDRVSPIDKLSRALLNGELETGTIYPVNVGKRAKKKVQTFLTIDIENMENVTVGTLSKFDREVHDAVISLMDAGNRIVTPGMIYKTMVGDSGARISPDYHKAIMESVHRGMVRMVTIDASNECHAHGLKVKNPIFRGQLLPMKTIEAVVNGEKTACLEILGTPILYDYARAKNQIARVDIKMLDSPVKKTREVIVLQGYLVQRIMAMKSERLSNIIKYETIYSHMEAGGSTKVKRQRTRSYVKEIMEYWTQNHFIKGFEELKHGNRLHGVRVEI